MKENATYISMLRIAALLTSISYQSQPYFENERVLLHASRVGSRRWHWKPEALRGILTYPPQKHIFLSLSPPP